MSHDIWASFATAELAKHFGAYPAHCFATPPPARSLSVFVGGRGRAWPFEDGAIVVESGTTRYKIAVEFKRQNEGLHGMLTAMGQSLAYLHKGSSGSLIVIPRRYSSYLRPGDYVREVVDVAVGRPTVGVFTYEDPDTTKASPFAGKLRCERPLEVDASPAAAMTVTAGVAETQWMHVREGSTTPSAFFKYLQTAKILAAGTPPSIGVTLPRELRDAVRRINPTADPYRYLSYTVGTTLHDEVWRHFWLHYVFTEEVMPIWEPRRTGTYQVNDVSTRLQQADGTSPMKFFSGKANSIKNRLVANLNAGRTTEDAAWEVFAGNVRRRAHSFREDVDSGLEGMGLLESDGRPTDLGYRFVDACERTGDPHAGTPRAMLGAALIKNGELGAFLHYVYKLSEDRFRANPLEFSTGTRFNSEDYLGWIEDELADSLRVMRKVAARGGVARRPFQAELAILRKFDFVSNFRIGVGLEVNWPAVQDAISYPI